MNMKTSRAVALRVSNLLVKSGMTRYKLCQKVSLSEMTLKHLIDEDHKSINLNTVILIAEGFGMSLKEFFDDDLFNPDNLEAD